MKFSISNRNSLLAVGIVTTSFAFSQQKIMKAEEIIPQGSQQIASNLLLDNDIEKELNFAKPINIHNPTDCNVFEENQPLTCFESSSTYEPQDDFDLLIQKGFGYATRLFPMLNEGGTSSDLVDVIRNDGKAFIISGVNASANAFLNQNIQKIPFFAQTSVGINSGGSDISTSFSIDSLMKLKELQTDEEGDPKTLLFSQVKFTTSSESEGSTTNFGLGIRNRPNDVSMLGANIFWDYRALNYSSAHSRIGVGGEYLWKDLEFRNNWYISATDKKNVTINGNDYTERVVPGWDVEIGYRLPQYPQLGIFARHFYWDYEDTDNNIGAELSINWQVTPHVNIETWISNELSAVDTQANASLPGTDETFFGVRLKFLAQPVNFKKKSYKKNMVIQMTQPVRRKYDVLLERSSGTFTNRAQGA